MMRIERMVQPDAIRHEVDTYNELIPFRGELSATLLIEYESPKERDVKLRELVGLEGHVWITVADQPPAKARFDTRQIATDRLSAVQYLKFPLTPEQRSRWMAGARIVITHPDYPADQALTPNNCRNSRRISIQPAPSTRSSGAPEAQARRGRRVWPEACIYFQKGGYPFHGEGIG